MVYQYFDKLLTFAEELLLLQWSLQWELMVLTAVARLLRYSPSVVLVASTLFLVHVCHLWPTA